MTVLLWLLFADASSLSVDHPTISCWAGERSWTGPHEPASSTTVFSTEGEPLEVRIEHHRDQIRAGTQLEQDYNFIDYRFPSRPDVSGRVYLSHPETVFVLVRDGEPMNSLAGLRRAAGEEILCYLQKRFQTIEAPNGETGYAPVWQAD